ncbi:acyl carrier protein phosphodiesterase [Pedobacter sp. UYEF25]
MNFLSHYYFDRASDNNFQIIGSVLPDLVKNAVPIANLFPNRVKEVYNLHEMEILTGWNKHLLIDKTFHSSIFFQQQTANLKPLLIPLLSDTQIRPSFLAHIGLELLLDHLLVEQKIINVKTFYSSLNDVDSTFLRSFLTKAGLKEVDAFLIFFNKFLASQYLFSYEKLKSISYALNQICLRLWPLGLDSFQLENLTEILSVFKRDLSKDFNQIFDQIDAKLVQLR